LRRVRKATEPEKAQKLIARALPPVVAAAITQPCLEEIRQQLMQLPEPPSQPRLTRSDWLGALGVFLLVVICTFPMVLPFLFIGNALRAQRLSNAVAIGMLFLTGYAFGRRTGYHPKVVGLAMVVLGGILVGLAIALGG